MKFLKKIFGKQDLPPKPQQRIKTTEEFWDWFVPRADRFHTAVRNKNDIEFEFINPVFNKLMEIREGVFLLTGMQDEHTAELIFTAECNLKLFPHIKELVSKAPKLNNWTFTSLKPKLGFEDINISMDSKMFTGKNISFYPAIDEEYPDDITIKLVYTDPYDKDESELIQRGCYVYLDNYLGEENSISRIDGVSIDVDYNNEQELNPIEKLESYLNWREKEFLEKYEGTVYDSDNDNYASVTWENEDKAIIGVCNTDLIRWDAKASHPWVVIIDIDFENEQSNGMPDERLLEKIYHFEDEIRTILEDKEGYVHVGHTTGEGQRKIYYACKDYYKPIEVFDEFKNKVEFKYDFEIFKDKYWRSMSHFEH